MEKRGAVRFTRGAYTRVGPMEGASSAGHVRQLRLRFHARERGAVILAADGFLLRLARNLDTAILEDALGLLELLGIEQSQRLLQCIALVVAVDLVEALRVGGLHRALTGRVVIALLFFAGLHLLWRELLRRKRLLDLTKLRLDTAVLRGETVVDPLQLLQLLGRQLQVSLRIDEIADSRTRRRRKWRRTTGLDHFVLLPVTAAGDD